MRIIVVGASGTLGKAAVDALKQQHDIIQASRNSEVQVDLSDPASIKAMYAQVTDIDAVVCAAGDARFGPLADLTDADFDLSLGNKLMGQINLVRFGREHLNEAGVFTLTTGMLAHMPNAATVMLTMINRALEAFVEAAALDMPRNQRLNAVCSPMAKETAEKMGWGPGGVPAAEIAKYYVQSLESDLNGALIGPAHSD
ncbi:MAG: short chain dehydrogenase [Desulfobacterales bacterium]|nr:short chain dehydrogenase [Desulfobacterales bacterium]